LKFRFVSIIMYIDIDQINFFFQNHYFLQPVTTPRYNDSQNAKINVETASLSSLNLKTRPLLDTATEYHRWFPNSFKLTPDCCSVIRP
jgi:hypothetical protein